MSQIHAKRHLKVETSPSSLVFLFLRHTQITEERRMFLTHLPAAEGRQGHERLFTFGSGVLVYSHHLASSTLTRDLTVYHTGHRLWQWSTWLALNAFEDVTFKSECQLTTKRVLPMIKCDQLSSSNASPPVMTKLARKRLMTFWETRSSWSSPPPCLWQKEMRRRCSTELQRPASIM